MPDTVWTHNVDITSMKNVILDIGDDMKCEFCAMVNRGITVGCKRRDPAIYFRVGDMPELRMGDQLNLKKYTTSETQQ